MIAMKFDKRFYFDRKAVADIVGKDAAKSLGRAGAFVQRRARSSLRRRKKTSNAGQPPSVHSQDSYATLKNIQFQFVPASMSVFVGPVLLNGSSGTPVPGLHERGLSAQVALWRLDPTWYRKSRLRWGDKTGERNKWVRSSPKAARRSTAKLNAKGIPTEVKTIRASYPERPFMGPALEKESPKFPSLFGRSA